MPYPETSSSKKKAATPESRASCEVDVGGEVESSTRSRPVLMMRKEMNCSREIRQF